jgi:hypothetical protein
MFSLEIPETMTMIEDEALYRCDCLRNILLPSNAVSNGRIFFHDNGGTLNVRTDLQELFGDSYEIIIRELQHRFDGLPIHRLIYYHSYNQGMLQDLISVIDMRSGQHEVLGSNKLNPTGNQQDCLGMTPLHILARSSVHDLELYRVIIETYPTNLITEDSGGAAFTVCILGNCTK